MTFSVVFAYVADITEESERSSAYGLVHDSFLSSREHCRIEKLLSSAKQSTPRKCTCARVRLLFQVSATFAASLVTSPALGAFLGDLYGDEVVVALATAIAVLDVLFILSFVPESLPEKARFANASNFSWDVADPCAVRNSNTLY